MDYRIKLTYATGENNNEIVTDKSDENVEIIYGAEEMRVTISPHKPISRVKFELSFPLNIENDDLIYCEGFQSWSFSREYAVIEKYEKLPKGLNPLAKSFGVFKIGNEEFAPDIKGRGVFMSSSFFYVRKVKSEQINLFGTAGDRNGYTSFAIDCNKKLITVYKDLEGKTFDTESEIINIVNFAGEYDEVFDKYFDVLGVEKPKAITLKGYSSWYNYYRNISENSILSDLNAISAYGDKINAFQIDDGYQTAIGDLTEIDKTKFPNGIKPIVDAIHAQKLLAGIWACPFGVTKESKIFTEHGDYLLKNEKGKPIKTGIAWGGFYSLDFYNKDAREYIRKSLVEIISWGVDFLKLDFLYAAACVPRCGKTRAEVMYEVMEFLRECVGDKAVIACGAPIMPSLNNFEYMRVGGDCSFYWSKPYDGVSREMVSTSKTVLNSIYRRFYNGRAFLNDPDVFFLRDDNIKMIVMQKQIHALLCKLFGSVLFVSDNVGGYSESAKEFYNLMLSDKKYEVISVNQIAKYVIEIKYSIDGDKKLLVFNYKNGDIYRMQELSETKTDKA